MGASVIRRLCAAALCVFFSCAFADDCPKEGRGTRNDPLQNVLKNRDEVPSSCEDMTIGQFNKAFKKNLNTQRARRNFTQAQLDAVAPAETGCVRLTGYILRAVKQGPETANCGSKTRSDIHVWYYYRTNDQKDERTRLRGYAVVTEVTPRWLDNHPTWTHSKLEQLARNRVRVRLSGWIMYDPEHPDHIGKTRGTLWELHPIAGIETWNGTAWEPM